MEWSLEKRQFQGFPLAVYTNAKGSPLGIRPHLETAKFCPNSAQRAPFFAACWRAKTGGLCHLHIPCRRRGASASRQRTLCSTRSGWHAALSLTPWRDHCNTHRSSLRLTLVAVFAGARERHHREWPRRTFTIARCPTPPTPRLPPSQRGPHLSCPCAAHHGLIWSPSRRQGGAVEEPQSEAMEVDSTMEARPHASRRCARHRPRRCSRGCSALWNLLTLVLCRA